MENSLDNRHGADIPKSGLSERGNVHPESTGGNRAQPDPAVSIAPLPIKIIFWLLLGATSVILAEVVSFSSPFPFFDGWGLLVVVPLYTLHSLVLVWIVFRPKRITFRALFLAGAIFGMYEAYITKVLWQPTWGDATRIVGGLSLMQTAVLALFWHPLMSFILPLIVAEGLFTVSHETADTLPQFLRPRPGTRAAFLVAAIFAVYCGLTQGLNSPSPGVSWISGLAAGLVFGALALVWRRITRGRAYTLRALLPSGREGFFLGAILLVDYLWQGIFIRPEALPRTPGPHLTVWGIYLVLGTLLYFTIWRAPGLPPADDRQSMALLPTSAENRSPRFLSWRMAWVFWIVFPLTSAVATLIKPAAAAVVLLSWGLGIGLGVLTLVRSVLALIRKDHG
jgi:hypothetical protein